MFQNTAIGHAKRSMGAIDRGFAAGRLADMAVRTMPAGPDQGNKNRITNRITADIRSKRGNLARRLVAIDCRQGAAPGPLGIGNIRVADRAGRNSHLNLALFGRAQVDLFDYQGFSEFVAYRSLHVTLLVWVNDPDVGQFKPEAPQKNSAPDRQ
jgi:hypothetical protein